ncbi:hypothetical protein DPMN_186725 [Dreissena polymorpha]|uniref:Uncharacterized protein n=1 Tax=Dreissena polymorpha TaxID=45954 RepID=A0A9D4DP78_DREPO|nr:hypothetical protein DPMN_186725 [Dreissena polymorpha]
MPRGRKRKTPAQEMEAALMEPVVEKHAGNIIDFEQITRDSNIVPSISHVVQSVSTPNMVTGCGCGAIGSLSSSTFHRTRCTSDEVFGHVPMQLLERILEQPVGKI